MATGEKDGGEMIGPRKCTSTKHYRVENPDGTWPAKCQCGKVDFTKARIMYYVHIVEKDTAWQQTDN